MAMTRKQFLSCAQTFYDAMQQDLKNSTELHRVLASRRGDLIDAAIRAVSFWEGFKRATLFLGSNDVIREIEQP